MAPSGLSEAATNGETKPAGTGALEQFLILSKSARGLAAVELIKQVLEHGQIFVFAELLDQQSIKDLEQNPEYASYVKLLRLFAFGVYNDYVENQATLPELSPPMLAKLRYLTIVALSSKTKRIPYSTLLKELSIQSLRQLEDLIIEMIYANVVTGKMDQLNGWLEIDSTIARDITPEQLSSINTVLTDWCDNCDNVLSNIEQQILLANTIKGDNSKQKADIDAQIAKIKATIKTSSQDLEEGDGVVNSGTPPQIRDAMASGEKMKRSLMRSARSVQTRNTPSSSKGVFWKNN